MPTIPNTALRGSFLAKAGALRYPGTVWSILPLLLLSAPDPGEPIAPVPLPKGVEVAPWDGLDVAECKERLLAAGLTGRDFRFSKSTWVSTKKVWGADPIHCHIPQATIIWTGPTGVRYNGYTNTTCGMALAMTRMERIVQEEARRVFGHPETINPVLWISHMGTYNCRTLRFKAKQSQHSFGNGLDLAGFWVRGYGVVEVKRHWNPVYKSWERPSEFLKSVSKRLRDEQVFTNVLDPDSDPGHWNHIHVDLAPTSDGDPSPALERVRDMPRTVAGEPRVEDDARP